MNFPKISIVTPSYNQGEYLEQTIKSVLDQNYPNLEYIIMDGGSTDNSVEIIKKYEKYLTYWQSKPDGGQSAAINEGFRHATGEIYAWLNSDDQYAEKALHIVGNFFNNNYKEKWLSGNSIIMNSKGKTINLIVPKELDYNSLINWYDNIIYQPSTFWLSDIWLEVTGLNERLNYSMDFDLWLKFSKRIRGKIIDKTLSMALQHKKMKTMQYQHKSFIETALVLSLHGEINLAKKLLSRPIKRAFELDKVLSFITKNKYYRYWRLKQKEKNK